jgi:hypothetical protein
VVVSPAAMMPSAPSVMMATPTHVTMTMMTVAAFDLNDPAVDIT